MTIRTVARSALIRSAAALRADKLTLVLRRWLVRSGLSPRLLAVEMHETPERDAAQLRRQLEWAARHFQFVDLSGFANLWQEYRVNPRLWKITKPPLLFTFDDGRQNNYTVAAPLLESFGTHGVFFVVPQFVQCSPQEARQFYYSRIDIREFPPSLPDEETRSMTPDQIADLARRGHAIGNHTYSHVNLRTLPGSQLHHEIVDSAEQIAAWAGQPVNAFAWTFSWDSITPAAWKLIQQHHRFCFAPCPGSVDCRTDTPSLIWRIEVEVDYPPADFRFMYSGLADALWGRKRRRLRSRLTDALAAQSTHPHSS